MTKPLLTVVFIATVWAAGAQPCSPQGDQNTYGLNDQWIGYVYDDIARTTYMGYVTQGVAGNPDFDQAFGGATATYPTNGCSVSTTTFSVRYKLQKSFTAGNYTITVGGDDGYRLSVDGGATWVINRYTDQSYVTTTSTVALSGTALLVLEYYENSGDNRISFSIAAACNGSENTAVYGSGNVWYGYIYDGIAFDVYAGRVTAGTAGNANFDVSFGGNNVNYATSGCQVQTETFSARYRLQKSFVNKSVTFTVGADDGYRLSIDGGVTWLINQWHTQSYVSSMATVTLNGTYNLVLEYYENTGENRVSFSSVENIVLPLEIVSFSGNRTTSGVDLAWNVMTNNEYLIAEPQRSIDGTNFITLTKTVGPDAATWIGSYTDLTPPQARIYYRLKITGADNQPAYSSMIVLRPGNNENRSTLVYPTVLSRTSSLKIIPGNLSGLAEVVVYDAEGRAVTRPVTLMLQPGGASELSLGRYNLATGVHVVTITDTKGNSSVHKLVIR